MLKLLVECVSSDWHWDTDLPDSPADVVSLLRRLAITCREAKRGLDCAEEAEDLAARLEEAISEVMPPDHEP